MRKILLATVAAASLFSLPALAASAFTFGGGFNAGQANVFTGAGSAGTAAAGALGASQNTSIGTGIAVASPAGNVAAGLGASAGQSGVASGAVSIGNGLALSGGSANNAGVGLGTGIFFTQP